MILLTRYTIGDDKNKLLNDIPVEYKDDILITIYHEYEEVFQQFVARKNNFKNDLHNFFVEEYKHCYYSEIIEAFKIYIIKCKIIEKNKRFYCFNYFEPKSYNMIYNRKEYTIFE